MSFPNFFGGSIFGIVIYLYMRTILPMTNLGIFMWFLIPITLYLVWGDKREIQRGVFSTVIGIEIAYYIMYQAELRRLKG